VIKVGRSKLNMVVSAVQSRCWYENADVVKFLLVMGAVRNRAF